MNFDEILMKLQTTYIQNMPDKISKMKENIDKKNFKALREDFHKIKGTGTTYGLPEVSELGATFEEILVLCQFSPQINWALDAYDIFKEIHASRLNAQAYPIHNDPKFKNLKNVLLLLKK